MPIWTDIRTGGNQNAYVARGVFAVTTPTSTAPPSDTPTPPPTSTATASATGTATASATAAPPTATSAPPTGTRTPRAERDALRHHVQRRASDRLLLHAGAVPGLPRRRLAATPTAPSGPTTTPPARRWSRSSCSASTCRCTTPTPAAATPSPTCRPASPSSPYIETAAARQHRQRLHLRRARRAVRRAAPALLPPLRQRDARAAGQDRRGGGAAGR